MCVCGGGLKELVYTVDHYSDPPSVAVVERWLPQGRQMEVPAQYHHYQFHSSKQQDGFMRLLDGFMGSVDQSNALYKLACALFK